MSIIKLPWGIRDAMLPKLSGHKTFFFIKYRREVAFHEKWDLTFEYYKLMSSIAIQFGCVKTLCYYFIRTLMCFSVYKVLPKKEQRKGLKPKNI